MKNKSNKIDFPPRVSLLYTILFLLTLSVFQGCYRNVLFEKNTSIDPKGWHYQDEIAYSTIITDTTSLFDIYINVRNTTDYPYSNLILFFTTEFPDGRQYRDTVECMLADKTGEWTGSGFGRIRSNSFHFRKDVWFPLQGEHTFMISQAMREEYLIGIKDIGIRIERK
jgi:gliding motility-associated lipoprotein GldH